MIPANFSKPSKDELKRDRGALVRALNDAGAGGWHGGNCRCPFHDDASASGSVYQDRDAPAWLFKCHGCGFVGDYFAVVAKTRGCDAADVLAAECGSDRPAPRPGNPPAKGHHVYPHLDALATHFAQATAMSVAKRHVYTNPETQKPDMVIFRLEGGGKKSFRQARPVDGGWVAEAADKPWPLYNRTRLKAAQSVIVVEGEKCVEALTPLGFVATTAPCGALKGEYADWTPLAGKSHVYLWPDYDAEVDGVRKGYLHMQQVAKCLEVLDPPPQVYWIDPENTGVPEKGDVVDYLALFDGPPDVKSLAVHGVLEEARPLGGPAAETAAIVEDMIAGRRAAVEWPWPQLGVLTQALLPGTVTVLCGDPGSTKSFALLEAAWFWIANGHKVAVYELEEERWYHLLRALAQTAGNANLTNAGWVRDHPDEARKAMRENAAFIDGLGRSLWDAPDKQLTHDELLAWIETQGKAGKRIVAIDPVTAAAASKEPWIDDLKFVLAAKGMARRYGMSVVLVTHPKKGKKTSGGMGMDDMAGGAGYQRFPQTVLWVHRHPKPKAVRVRHAHGEPCHVKINRTVHIVKSRNGPGGGANLGYIFSGESLRLAEQGVILADEEGAGDE